MHFYDQSKGAKDRSREQQRTFVVNMTHLRGSSRIETLRKGIARTRRELTYVVGPLGTDYGIE
jgi:hypothetical protein